MIARMWRGWAAPAGAAAYERYFAETLTPELLAIDGCLGAHLLRRPAGDEVELSTLVWFESMDAVRRFAGVDPERAVVSEHARSVLTRYEPTVAHFEVAATAGRPGAQHPG